MNIKITRILAILSLSVFFNLSCMEPVSVNQRLINAAATGNLEEVQDALKEGADINYHGKCYSTKFNNNISGSAITLAALGGYLEITKFLIISGVQVDVELLYKIALDWGHFQIAEYLIESKIGILKNYSYHEQGSNLTKFLVWHGIPHRKKDHKDIKYVIDKHETLLNRMLNLSDNKYTKEEFKEINEIISETKKTLGVLQKFALKLENFRNKSFKNIVKKVNQIKVTKIKEVNILPRDLQNIVIDYSLYPENMEKFFEISEEDLEEIIKVYSEELDYKENDFSQDTCLIM